MWISKIKKNIRFNHWWNYKVPPMLCFAYLFLYINRISLKASLINLFFFLIWIISTAAIGYISNDMADIKSDRLAGKNNAISELSPLTRYIFLSFTLIISFIPWLYLPLSPIIISLVITELVLFFVYSFPPLRLKEQPVAGILCDALYGHAVIILISVLVFSNLRKQPEVSSFFLILIFFWQLIKGLRNILLHQVDDRKNDKRSNTTTFVLKYGPLATINLINRLILPLEIIILSLITGCISQYLDNFFYSFILFMIFSGLNFSIWKYFTIPKRQFRLKFIYFLNDYYEEWMPVIMIFYLINTSNTFWLLLILHLLFFYPLISNFFQDIFKIKNNLADLMIGVL
jgi:hypothetical protein